MNPSESKIVQNPSRDGKTITFSLYPSKLRKVLAPAGHPGWEGRISKLVFPTSGKPFFRLPAGRFAETDFGFSVDFCDNPFCPCTEMRFYSYPTGKEKPTKPYYFFAFNFETHSLRGPEHPEDFHPESFELGKAFFNTLSIDDYDYLCDCFFAFREKTILDCSPKDARAQFPATPGTVLFSEIFPMTTPLGVMMDGAFWMATDHYCVQPDCSCRETFIEFSRVNIKSERPPPPHQVAISYDYEKNRVKSVEADTSGQERMPDRLVAALLNDYPGIDQEFRRRHRLLKSLYTVWKKKNPHPSDVSQIRPMKVGEIPGRNDLCPCGSGKKFKKCCGNR